MQRSTFISFCTHSHVHPIDNFLFSYWLYNTVTEISSHTVILIIKVYNIKHSNIARLCCATDNNNKIIDGNARLRRRILRVTYGPGAPILCTMGREMKEWKKTFKICITSPRNGLKGEKKRNGFFSFRNHAVPISLRLLQPEQISDQ